MARRRRHARKRDKRLLLVNLAQVLNSMDKAGMNPRMKHGIVYTDYGYVLPIKDRWSARALRKIS